MGELKDTLCWTCEVPGTGKCSWDLNLTPVEGWEAEPTKLSLCRGETTSYHVIRCPLYRPMVLAGRKHAASWGTMPEDTVFGLMFATGMTTAEISAKTGISRRTIHRKQLRWMRAKGEAPEEGEK